WSCRTEGSIISITGFSRDCAEAKHEDGAACLLDYLRRCSNRNGKQAVADGNFRKYLFSGVPVGASEICDRQSLGGKRSVRNPRQDSWPGSQGSRGLGPVEVFDRSEWLRG